MTQIILSQITRYPVKGLGPQQLTQAELSPGAPLPGDRRFALAHGASQYDAAHPGWCRKAHFLTWARQPAMAAITSSFAADGSTVSLRHHGRDILANADLATQAGREALTAALLPILEKESRGRIEVAEGKTFSFSDVEPEYLSLQSAATLAELSARIGINVAPERMRGNLLLEGAAPWAEMDWPGRRFRLGAAEIEVVETIGRCAATTLDPKSGARDLEIPAELQRLYGHQDCGVYAKVTRGGKISRGDRLEEIQ